MPSKKIFPPAFYVRILLCVCVLLCPACASEPENVRDMLLNVAKNSATNPEKCLEVYKRFGSEGEEALIRAYFQIGYRLPYLDEEVHGEFRKTPPTLFLEKLSENKDYLRRILDIARTGFKNADTNPYQWVWSHDEQLFMQRLRSLDLASESNWLHREREEERFSYELIAMWEIYMKEKPDEAFQDMMALFAQHVTNPLIEKRLGFWAAKLLNYYAVQRPGHKFSPEDLHLFFANGYTRILSRGWNISVPDWLRECPQDLGLALEQQYVIRNAELERHKSSHLIPYADKYFIELPHVPNRNTFTGKGSKFLIYYREIKPEKETGGMLDGFTSIPVISMQALPKELAANSLLEDNRAFLITKSFTVVHVLRTKKGDAVLKTWYQVWLTVTWYDAQSDSFRSEKFAGNKPDLLLYDQAQRNAVGTGGTPWDAAHDFILRKIAR